jgi:hypothetical protein
MQHKTSNINTSSITSNCGGYRYLLTKVWAAATTAKPHGLFICQNPSIADELRYDVTLANITTLSVNWGWSGFTLVNLHPSYSTNPANIIHNKKHERINRYFIYKAIKNATIIVVAPGNGYLKDINDWKDKFPQKNYQCIAKNKKGDGRHPSRVNIKDYPNPTKY